MSDICNTKPTKPMSRSDMREKCVDAVYSALISLQAKVDYDPEELFVNLFKADGFSSIDLYAQEVFVQALSKKDEIIGLIQPHLVKWTFSRLNTTAQAILLVAVAESRYAELTPKPVAISCAVDLAKKYLDKDDYKYINAVLDKAI